MEKIKSLLMGFIFYSGGGALFYMIRTSGGVQDPCLLYGELSKVMVVAFVVSLATTFVFDTLFDMKKAS